MGETFETRSKSFRKKVANAALWMKRRHVADDHFWRWSVLTAHNPDPDKRPKYDDQTAQFVFEDLENRGLLIEVDTPPDGSGATAFLMRYDIKGWDDVVVDGRPVIGWFLKVNRDWAGYLVSFLAGCLLNRATGLIERFLDWLF